MLSPSGKAEDESAPPHEGSTSPTRHSGNASTPAKALRRACDCCRKRKVKCDGADPCGPCKKATIRCAYLQPPKKKGPKGLRSAKVLRALRQIDGDASLSPVSPVSPGRTNGFGPWGWPQQTTSLHSDEGFGRELAPQIPGPYAVLTSDEAMMATQTSSTVPRSLPPTSHNSAHWSHDPSSISAGSDLRPVQSPTTSEAVAQRIPGEAFLPYIDLFYSHMFPIMPVIDRIIYLDPSLYIDSRLWSPDTYCFLCALCAATVVQLDASILQPPPLHPTKSADHLFADECLRERKAYDYIEPASTLSVMTAFFLFAYYGNHEKHGKAWHYLQECITFSENLNMDVEDSYAKLDPVEAQWRRRLYWLLFITERAYAVQRKKNTRLHAGVQLPEVFDSEDPQLLSGFVNLANLFSAVGDDFVRAWRGSRRASLCNEIWLADIQKQLDAAALASGDITESQKLDISVTREWLHVLAWQMGVSNGLIWGRGDAGMRLDYPIDLARKVVEITSSADALALDSHGIGMEQKLSDIAGCLADVLKCTAGDTSSTFLEGKQYLHILMQQLSRMRGRESRYLKPLMSKTEGVLGYELSNQTLPLPADTAPTLPLFSSAYLDHQRFSVTDSLGMLRRISMDNSFVMPGLNMSFEDWGPRRPSGRIYDESDTNWPIDDAVPAM